MLTIAHSALARLTASAAVDNRDTWTEYADTASLMKCQQLRIVYKRSESAATTRQTVVDTLRPRLLATIGGKRK